jgi:hypothetical protein
VLENGVDCGGFFDGENVVECVVNVVGKHHVCGGGKMGQVF